MEEFVKKIKSTMSHNESGNQQQKEPIRTLFSYHYVLKNMSNDIADAQMVLQLFISETPKLFDELLQSIDDSNYVEIKRLSHSIRGAASNLEAKPFVVLCLQLEKYVQDHDNNKILELRNQLVHSYYELVTAVKKQL